MLTRIARITIIFILLSLVVFTYSFFNPGNAKILDEIRLTGQSKVMAATGNYVLDDFYFDKNNSMTENDALQYGELEHYFSYLQTGDILFTESGKYLSSRFIPGKWKHAVIYLGTEEQISAFFINNPEAEAFLQPYYETGNERLVLDSSSDGVQIRDIRKLSNLEYESYLLSLSAFRLDRDDDTKHDFVINAFSHVGKNYDYDLITTNSETLYCSELIYQGLQMIDIELTITDSYFGRPVISPTDTARYIVKKGIVNEEFSFLFFLEKENGVVLQQQLKDFSFE